MRYFLWSKKESCIKGGRGCLFYQIGKCLAPCEGKITQQSYQVYIDKALVYIYNKGKLIEDLRVKMERLSSEFRFEEAMVLRDRIKTIEKSELKSTLDFASDDNSDLFSVVMDHDRAVVVKMFIRQGKLISATHNFVATTEITTIEEIYKTAIISYYSHEIPTIPYEILIPHSSLVIEELEIFIAAKTGKKVKIMTPKIGKKRDLIEMALTNCNELLKIDMAKKSDIYHSLETLLDLGKKPYRIECFDNSHNMGQATVGSMVVWDNDQFISDDYRLYHLDARDEYAQMKEMLMRRVERFGENPPPDLWLIDGGRTLVILALAILESVGVSIDVVGIAKEKRDAKANRSKGGARDILYTKEEIWKLESTDKRLQFLQRVRDEAHRKAIGFHQKQKRKEDKQISLLDIKGIGKAKVQKLLHYFGSFEAIKKASFEELKEVLNEKDATLALHYFNQSEQ